MPQHNEVSPDGHFYFDSIENRWVPFGVDHTAPGYTSGQPSSVSSHEFAEATEAATRRGILKGCLLVVALFVGFSVLGIGACTVWLVVGGDRIGGTSCSDVSAEALTSTQANADDIGQFVDLRRTVEVPEDFSWPSGSGRVLVSECVGSAVLLDGTVLPVTLRMHATSGLETEVEYVLG